MRFAGRKDVVEAVVIAVLVAAGTKAIDLIAERLTKTKRRPKAATAKRKRR